MGGILRNEVCGLRLQSKVCRVKFAGRIMGCGKVCLVCCTALWNGGGIRGVVAPGYESAEVKKFDE